MYFLFSMYLKNDNVQCVLLVYNGNVAPVWGHDVVHYGLQICDLNSICFLPLYLLYTHGLFEERQTQKTCF